MRGGGALAMLNLESGYDHNKEVPQIDLKVYPCIVMGVCPGEGLKSRVARGSHVTRDDSPREIRYSSSSPGH